MAEIRETATFQDVADFIHSLEVPKLWQMTWLNAIQRGDILSRTHNGQAYTIFKRFDGQYSIVLH